MSLHMCICTHVIIYNINIYIYTYIYIYIQSTIQLPLTRGNHQVKSSASSQVDLPTRVPRLVSGGSWQRAHFQSQLRSPEGKLGEETLML